MKRILIAGLGFSLMACGGSDGDSSSGNASESAEPEPQEYCILSMRSEGERRYRDGSASSFWVTIDRFTNNVCNPISTVVYTETRPSDAFEDDEWIKEPVEIWGEDQYGTIRYYANDNGEMNPSNRIAYPNRYTITFNRWGDDLSDDEVNLDTEYCSETIEVLLAYDYGSKYKKRHSLFCSDTTGETVIDETTETDDWTDGFPSDVKALMEEKTNQWMDWAEEAFEDRNPAHIEWEQNNT